ncbi:MAG: deoxyribodipyrimidine photo-lyase [Deltaproteobacteria bacterium]|nr:deoxyribodipyrimidine photo-lyase [Deltaproteobacteria bacterium]
MFDSRDIRIQQSRIKILNGNPVLKKDYILYWMQQSQRAEYNHALEYAVGIANYYKLPVMVLFILMDDFPEANLRHYTFMMEGLSGVKQALNSRGIGMTIQKGDRELILGEAVKRAAAVVCDRGYLKYQRLWRKMLAQIAPCRVIQVESDVIVPIETASPKAQYAAYTLRPKINRLIDDYLIDVEEITVIKSMPPVKMKGIDARDFNIVLKTLPADKMGNNVLPVSKMFYGGTQEAKIRFADFLKSGAHGYAQNSNQPQTDDVSHMGPYLHFGQISPLYLALTMQRAEGISAENKSAFLEQIIVRRELSANFVYYSPGYDDFNVLPGWARETLKAHSSDERKRLYSIKQLEAAKTHDPYWNAAMKEMMHTGYMHNYMRMYWAKKVIEWTPSPQKAFKTLLYLNNKYFLDGRDPNSYAGIGWAFGLHDRAWRERPIFGKVRYMAASGLERKCDIKAYVEKVKASIQEIN